MALQLERRRESDRPSYIMRQLQRLALPVYADEYCYGSPTQWMQTAPMARWAHRVSRVFTNATAGNPCPCQSTNVWTVLRSSRASGAEALVLSASWADGDPINAGLLLTLLRGLKRAKWLSRDVVVVFAGRDGLGAWVDDRFASRGAHVAVGKIYAALHLAVQRPLDSLAVLTAGANSRLSNLDFFNTVVTLAEREYSGSLRLATAAHAIALEDEDGDLLPFPEWRHPKDRARKDDVCTRPSDDALSALPLSHVLSMGRVLDTRRVAISLPLLKFGLVYGDPPTPGYQASSVVLLDTLADRALGAPNGPHGWFSRHGVEALTVTNNRLPADLPMQVDEDEYLAALARVLEQTARCLSNLLEEFHQSFFLYILTAVHRFASPLTYHYPLGALLASLGLMLAGSYQDAQPSTPSAHASTHAPRRTRSPLRRLLRLLAAPSPSVDPPAPIARPAPKHAAERFIARIRLLVAALGLSAAASAAPLVAFLFFGASDAQIFAICVAAHSVALVAYAIFSSRHWRRVLASSPGEPQANDMNMNNPSAAVGRALMLVKGDLLAALFLLLYAVSALNVSLALFLGTTLLPPFLLLAPRAPRALRALQGALLLATHPLVWVLVGLARGPWDRVVYLRIVRVAMEHTLRWGALLYPALSAVCALHLVAGDLVGLWGTPAAFRRARPPAAKKRE